MFRRWIMLNTSYFASFHMLSLGNSSLAGEISAIIVKQPPEARSQPLPWHQTIEGLSGPLSSDEKSNAIKLLQDRVDNVMEDPKKQNKAPAIFHAFGSRNNPNFLTENRLNFTGNYHCEMVLAALIVFFALLISTSSFGLSDPKNALKTLIEVRQFQPSCRTITV
jgi:hypothetical protein